MAEQLRITTDLLHTMDTLRASTEREVSAKHSQISDSVAALAGLLHGLTHAVAFLAREMEVQKQGDVPKGSLRLQRGGFLLATIVMESDCSLDRCVDVVFF